MEQRHIHVEKCQRPNGTPLVLKTAGQVYRIKATIPTEGFVIEFTEGQSRPFKTGNLLFDLTLKQLRQSGIEVEIVAGQGGGYEEKGQKAHSTLSR